MMSTYYMVGLVYDANYRPNQLISPDCGIGGPPLGWPIAQGRADPMILTVCRRHQ